MKIQRKKCLRNSYLRTGEQRWEEISKTITNTWTSCQQLWTRRSSKISPLTGGTTTLLKVRIFFVTYIIFSNRMDQHELSHNHGQPSIEAQKAARRSCRANGAAARIIQEKVLQPREKICKYQSALQYQGRWWDPHAPTESAPAFGHDEALKRFKQGIALAWCEQSW